MRKTSRDFFSEKDRTVVYCAKNTSKQKKIEPTLISLSMLWKHMRTAFPPIYVHNLDRYNSVTPTETAKKGDITIL